MLSELPFAAHAIHEVRGVRGRSDESQRSYRMRNAFKAGKHYDRALALMVRSGYDHSPFLGPDALLVPVPRRAPTRAGDLWPAVDICKELVKNGYGGGWEALVRRTHAVKMSHGATSGPDRPSPEDHYKSFSVEMKLVPFTNLTLVDDFVTRGSTLIGCAARLVESYPDATVLSFAFARTISSGEIHNIEAPCDGMIAYTPGSNSPQRFP